MSGTATPGTVIAQLVETMRALAGSHPGFRPVHAKGIVCSGTFRGAPEARRVCRAPHLQGQAIVTVNKPGVIRGWHWHDRQTDVIVVVSGRAKVPLYDGRKGSKTFGQIEEHVCGDDDLKAVFVPPGVWHGYKTVSSEPAIIVNFPDQVYDAAHPDENRAPHDALGVPYDWNA